MERRFGRDKAQIKALKSFCNKRAVALDENSNAAAHVFLLFCVIPGECIAVFQDDLALGFPRGFSIDIELPGTIAVDVPVVDPVDAIEGFPRG